MSFYNVIEFVHSEERKSHTYNRSLIICLNLLVLYSLNDIVNHTHPSTFHKHQFIPPPAPPPHIHTHTYSSSSSRKGLESLNTTGVTKRRILISEKRTHTQIYTHAHTRPLARPRARTPARTPARTHTHMIYKLWPSNLLGVYIGLREYRRYLTKILQNIYFGTW